MEYGKSWVKGVSLLLVILSCMACAGGPAARDGQARTEEETLLGQEMDRGMEHARRRQFDAADQALTSLIDKMESGSLVEVYPFLARAAYMNRALVLLDMDAYARSAADVERALEIHRAHLPPDAGRESNMYATLGDAATYGGELSRGIRAYRAAIDLEALLPARDHLFAARVRVSLARAYESMNNMDDAIREQRAGIDEALAGSAESVQKGYAGSLYLDLVEMLRLVGRAEESVTAANDAIALLEQDGREVGLTASAYYLRAIGLSFSRGDKSAKESYLKAIELFDRTPQPNWDYLGVACYNVARIFEADGDRGKAFQYYSRAAQAYGHVVTILRSREAERPGSVPPNAMASFVGRLRDAERMTAATQPAAEGAP